jgi:uncharacterized membrane protein
MAFCTSCGAETNGRFCAKCGAPVAEQSQASSSSAPPLPPPPATAQDLSDNVASALCYLFPILGGILFLVLQPYANKKNIRFHAFQSILFGIVVILVHTGISLISLILLPIPFLGFAITLLLHLAVWLGSLFLWVMLMYKAYNNERWTLPVIGPMAEKQAYA